MQSKLKILVLLLLSVATIANAQELELKAPETIVEHQIARLSIKTDFKFVDVVVARDVFNTLPVIEEKTDELNQALKALDEAIGNKDRMARDPQGLSDAADKVKAALGSRSYVFTGSPGKYAIQVTGFDARYGIKKASAVITIGGKVDNDDEQDVDDGSTPAPTPPSDKYALDLWKEALKVKSDNRETEAKEFAKVFRSISGRAAGLGDWTAQDLLNETGKALNKSVSNEVKLRWNPWNIAMQNFLKSKGLTTKQEHVEAWLSIANALEAVK